MCNAEYMVYSAVYQKITEEALKTAEREAIRTSAGLAQSAEAIRRSQEETAVVEWFDDEIRQISAALGASEVVAGAAGVEIAAITNQWAQAQIELFGARKTLRRRQAAAGDLREAEIENVKNQRLSKTERADAFSWVMDIGQAFMQGVYMEKKITGGNDPENSFGIDASDWFKGGEKIMPPTDGTGTGEDITALNMPNVFDPQLSKGLWGGSGDMSTGYRSRPRNLGYNPIV